jgi:hypothetical protein
LGDARILSPITLHIARVSLGSMFFMAKPVPVLFHRTKQRQRLLFGKNIAEQFGRIERQNQGGQKPAGRRRALPPRE